MSLVVKPPPGQKCAALLARCALCKTMRCFLLCAAAVCFVCVCVVMPNAPRRAVPFCTSSGGLCVRRHYICCVCCSCVSVYLCANVMCLLLLLLPPRSRFCAMRNNIIMPAKAATNSSSTSSSSSNNKRPPHSTIESREQTTLKYKIYIETKQNQHNTSTSLLN